ncbi:MAG TPA: hypothetical protein VLK84_13825 [Longimicrobium sp.]|nr:hypothetical protein [Longimicrobium sp.]
MPLSIKPLSEITHEVISLLSREVGVANALRFLGQFASGTGNYTEERDALLGDLTLEEIVAEARRIQASKLAG